MRVMSLFWLFDTESNLMFSLANQTIWIVVTVCVTAIVLAVIVIVARYIYLRRRRQRSLAKTTKRHRRRPGKKDKAYNKRGVVEWDYDWGDNCG